MKFGKAPRRSRVSRAGWVDRCPAGSLFALQGTIISGHAVDHAEPRLHAGRTQLPPGPWCCDRGSCLTETAAYLFTAVTVTFHEQLQKPERSSKGDTG